MTTDQPSATLQKELLVATFQSLGVPIEEYKLEGPTTCLTFLGIEGNTIILQLRLPQVSQPEGIVNLQCALQVND